MARRIDLSAAHLSAMQTAALACAGGLIAACGTLVEFPVAVHKHGHHGTIWPWAVAMMTLFIGGYAVMLFAAVDLESGIAAERWPDREIERVRSLLKSRTVIFLSFAFFIGLLLTFATQRYRPLGWGLFALGQTLYQLQIRTREPSSNTPAQPTWTNLAPLQSQHWGER